MYKLIKLTFTLKFSTLWTFIHYTFAVCVSLYAFLLITVTELLVILVVF